MERIGSVQQEMEHFNIAVEVFRDDSGYPFVNVEVTDLRDVDPDDEAPEPFEKNVWVDHTTGRFELTEVGHNPSFLL